MRTAHAPLLWLLLFTACGPAAKRPAVPGSTSVPAPVASSSPPPSVPSPPSAPSSPPAATARVEPPSATPLPLCPGDMVAIGPGPAGEGAVDVPPEGFCIDRYEAPNVRGERPLAQQTAYDGEAWCAARGKRLCTQDEWVRACEGTHGRRYPYGDEHRASVCNDDRKWIEVHWDRLARWPAAEAVDEGARLYQADESGARAGCVSEEGVYDLTGNVAEWVRRSGPSPRPGFDHVLKGCYWAGCYHEPRPNCVFANRAHASSFRSYEAGFRCCADRPAASARAR